MLDGVRDTVCPVGKAVRAGGQLAVALDADNTTERVLGNDPVDVGFHSNSLPDTASLAEPMSLAVS